MPEKPTRKPTRNPSKNTSWDPLAAWYDGWVGEQGSHFNQELAIPAILALLDLQPGEKLLDVGAGQGVLAPYAAKSEAVYVGVDASPRLIAMAKRRHGTVGTFLLGDARSLSGLPGIEGASFDAAAFLLSLQDMDPLEAVLSAAAWAVRPGGRLAAVLTHPCFRIPRQSGWGWDEGRQLQFRRVDRYLTPLPVPLKPFPGQQGVSKSYHRPLQDYVNGLGRNGFAVTRLVEIPTFKKASGPRARAENKAAAEIPLFLGISAVKIK